MPKLVQTVPALLQTAPTPTLLQAALWYIQQNIPVFPCHPGAKTPATRHGVKTATTDEQQIRTWWGQNPDYNIGLATGHRFDVVDIDGPEGHRQRAQHWCNTEGCTSAGTQGEPCGHDNHVFAQVDHDSIAKVLTPRPGGMHIWVPPTGDRNSAGIFPKIDYRGEGGYVLAPPSQIPEGQDSHPGIYQFLGTPTL